MSGHGHDDHGGGHDDHGPKGPKMPHLEEVVEEEFEKDVDKLGEFFNRNNQRDLNNHIGSAHDAAYESFKKKFEDLANEHHEPLAERGKELSTKHLNDLLEAYILPFIKETNGKSGSILADNYKKTKFDSETDRDKYLSELAQHAGLEDDIYKGMKKILKTNEYRHHSVINDLSKKIKDGVVQSHGNKAFMQTIGKVKYHKRADLALKAMNKLGKNVPGFQGYDMDNHEKSSFYKEDVNSLANHLIGMAQNDSYIIDSEELGKKGLKYNTGHDAHSDGDGGHHSGH